MLAAGRGRFWYAITPASAAPSARKAAPTPNTPQSVPSPATATTSSTLPPRTRTADIAAPNQNRYRDHHVLGEVSGSFFGTDASAVVDMLDSHAGGLAARQGGLRKGPVPVPRGQ